MSLCSLILYYVYNATSQLGTKDTSYGLPADCVSPLRLCDRQRPSSAISLTCNLTACRSEAMASLVVSTRSRQASSPPSSVRGSRAAGSSSSLWSSVALALSTPPTLAVVLRRSRLPRAPAASCLVAAGRQWRGARKPTGRAACTSYKLSSTSRDARMRDLRLRSQSTSTRSRAHIDRGGRDRAAELLSASDEASCPHCQCSSDVCRPGKFR